MHSCISNNSILPAIRRVFAIIVDVAITIFLLMVLISGGVPPSGGGR